MSLNRVLFFAFVMMMTIANFTFAQDQQQDDRAIRDILNQQVSTWNKGDATGYSQHFAENGTFTNILGVFYTGHEAFLTRHEEIFKGLFRGTHAEAEVVSLRFVRPDVAIAETYTSVSGFAAGPPPGSHVDDKGALHTRLLQVFTKESGDWKIVVYHNVDVKPGPPPRK
jgi:uncharacterized protein (TIGR02246 family)